MNYSFVVFHRSLFNPFLDKSKMALFFEFVDQARCKFDNQEMDKKQ